MRSRFGSLVLAAAAAFAAQLLAAPASAQFVCVDGSNSAQGATASGSADNMACGKGADAEGVNGTGNLAVGTGSGAWGNNSHNNAVGTAARADGDFSSNTALGSATAFGNRSNNTAVGTDAAASGMLSQNTAVGYSASALGDGGHNTSLGDHASSTGHNSANVAIGYGASADGSSVRNTAVGANSRALGNSVAIGADASALYPNSAAFGNGATATRANQQVFGTATNTYTMTGIASTSSKTAQGTATHLVTSNASGDLAAHTFSELGLASSGDLAGINSRLEGVDRRLDGADQKSDKALQGVAMAFAMAGAPTLSPNETFAVSGNWGGYEGKSGVAFGAALKLDTNTQLTAGVGYGVNEGTVGGRAGVRIGW